MIAVVPLVGEGEPSGLEVDALRLDPLAKDPGTGLLRQPEPDASSAVLRLGGSAGEVTLEGVVHHLAPLLVDARDLRDEAVEVPPLEKERHASLVVHRRMPQDVMAKGPRFADELAIGHQVADAQSGQERLREAAGMDDVAPGIEALQRRGGIRLKLMSAS